MFRVDTDLIPAFQFDRGRARLAGLELNFDIRPHPLDRLHIENTFSYVRGVFSDAILGTLRISII
jgi:iron complex outermembrane receptor protein